MHVVKKKLRVWPVYCAAIWSGVIVRALRRNNYGRAARAASTAWRFIGRVARAQAAPLSPRPASVGPHSAPIRPAPAASSSGPLQNVMFLLIFTYLVLIDVAAHNKLYVVL